MSLYFESKMGGKKTTFPPPLFFTRQKNYVECRYWKCPKLNVWAMKVNTDYCKCTFEPISFYLSSETFPTVFVGFYLSWENFGSLCESINKFGKVMIGVW